MRGTSNPSPLTISAIELVYDRGYRRFLHLAEAMVHDEETAHDVVQDGFAHAIRGRHDFRGDGSVEGWLWRIIVNTARSALRDRPSCLIPASDELAIASNGHAVDEDVRAVVAALPERQRLVLFLRYYADLDYRRIAEALEIQPGTVGATLNQAHAAVRHALKEVVQ